MRGLTERLILKYVFYCFVSRCRSVFFCLRPVLKSILYVQYIIYNTVHYAYCHYIANMFLKHYFLNCCFLYFHISPVGGGDISYAALQNLIYLTLTRITLLGLWLRERDLEKDSCWVKTMHKQKEISNIKLWLSLAVRLFGWNLTPLLVWLNWSFYFLNVLALNYSCTKKTEQSLKQVRQTAKWAWNLTLVIIGV